MAQLHLKIVTPEKLIFEDDVDQVNVTSTEGQLGILPHHTALMAKIVPGEMRVRKGNKEDIMASGGGFIQIENNNMTIMTDLAIDEKDIDEKAVETAKKRAEDALQQNLTNEEYAETLAILEKSLAQLRVKRRHHSRNI